ncbi:hypothetical protein [Streptomyces sp. NPDC005970]|uniref:hypothetical protein n=1 Tax=Streptomyces sp. NPDC005970 TaxID=3156723 RepID=UPI0033C68680
MPSREPAAEAGRRDDRSPSMRELLAACAAASAVSTPPECPSPGPAPAAAGEPGEAGACEGEDEPRRDAA